MNVKLQCGDVILVSNKGWLGKIIKQILSFFQNDEVNYSHVAVALSEIEIAEATWNGIIVRPPEEALEKVKAIKIIRYKHMSDMHRHFLKERLKSKIGRKYNFWRLFLQLFDNIFGTNWFTKHLRITKKEDICSTYVAWAYDKALSIRFNDVPWISVEPDDIDDESLKNKEDWEQIYRGERYY